MPAHLPGLILLSGAALLLWRALAHRWRVLALAARGVMAPPVPPSLRGPAGTGPAIIRFGLGLVALELIIVYVVSGGFGVFTIIDLIGALALILAYGVWITLRTRHRLPAG